VAEIDFPQRPPETLVELWQWVRALLPQLRRTVVRTFAVGTTETPLAHGMRFAPQMAHPVPRADVRVWQTQIPDARFVYLAASSACTVDVEIVP
jgi:hypothetical protein